MTIYLTTYKIETREMSSLSHRKYKWYWKNVGTILGKHLVTNFKEVNKFREI